jgi:hypothetical protein
MDPTVFITGLIAIIILIMVVCYDKSRIAHLTGKLETTYSTILDWKYSYDSLESDQTHLHCRTCPDPTVLHKKKFRGEYKYHCCNEYGHELCDCLPSINPMSDSTSGCLTKSKRSR